MIPEQSATQRREPSVDGCHEFHDAVQEGINLGFLVSVLARRGAEDGPADAVDAEGLVLLEVADQVMAQIVHVQDVVAAGLLLRGPPEAFPVRPVQAAPKNPGQVADLSQPGIFAPAAINSSRSRRAKASSRRSSAASTTAAE